MVRILYFDISEFCSRSRINPEQVLFFLNQPVLTFFTLLLRGVNGGMIWDTDPNRVFENKDEVFQHLLDAWEAMNLIDERAGIFSGTGYAGTLDYVGKKLDYYSERFYSILVPPQGGAFKVKDLTVQGDQLVIRLDYVGESNALVL